MHDKRPGAFEEAVALGLNGTQHGIYKTLKPI